ncbi:transposable element Tc3 transposase [Trichonephila clavipes]|uniref:Transposable element Tc3 transposase n=1 Tax=Trichonephila clavipes TaxID=2585209 RepID=A0A8X6VAB0_TRICX|nr:transposable element Tc3 transposase [Trichonephila clavipes]
MLNGRTKLHILDRGSVTGDSYCDEVLLPHVRLFRGAIGPDFIFMDTNARSHRILAVEELLEREDITRMTISKSLFHSEEMQDNQEPHQCLLAHCGKLSSRLHPSSGFKFLYMFDEEPWL